MSHAPRYVTVMVMCGLVSLLGTVTHAQDWFRQRTYDGVTAPVGPNSGEKGTRFVLPATRSPVGFPHTYQATGLPISIPDNSAAGISSTIPVPASLNVSSVSVSLEIRHTFRGDLRVTLTSPGGTVFTLSEPSGDAADNIVITNQNLNVAAGSVVQGNWVLKVADLDAIDTGQLVSWSLLVVQTDAALIDLTMSLESNPSGDNIGRTQGTPGSEQDSWERIIQHFADAVYEMTNGAHLIRQVRVFSKSANFGSADIQWQASGHPNASGVLQKGGRIAMFETYSDGPIERFLGHDYNLKGDEIASGYTMAHEWGHYFLGLYDEYDGSRGTPCPGSDIIVSVMPSIMNDTWEAARQGKIGNYRGLNLSIARPLTPLGRPQGPAGDFEDTLYNCQHFAYGASAWEVLARHPSADPNDSLRRSYQSLGERQYYPEMAGAAPAGGARPRIDLPVAGARSALDIVWMTDRQDMEIVIDRSGSMTSLGVGGGTKLEQAKTAAKNLVDLATLGKTRIGITAFDDTVISVIPLTRVDTEANRKSIRDAIDSIVAGGETHIGDAANAALTKLLASSTPDGNRVVFLLTDGQNSGGAEPLSVIPRYTTTKIPLFTIGFGSGADSATLDQLATGTGGRFFFSATSLQDIILSFQAANAVATSSPSLGSGSLAPSPTAPASLRLPLDPSLDRLQLSVVYSGNAPASAITLTSPTGQQTSPTSTSTVATQRLLFFDVGQPGAGNWQLTAAPSAAGTTFTYSIAGVHKSVGYDVNTGLRGNGSSVTTPGPVVIESKLSHHLAVSGASVNGTMTTPAGTTTNVQLADNGVYPDLVSRDGTYTGMYVPSGRGSYSLTVRFSNAALSAVETYRGTALLPSPFGTLVPPLDDVQVPEDFVRSQTFQFSVDTDLTQSAPALTTQPSSQTVSAGAGVTFIVTALGAPAPTYQWQRKPSGASSFSNLNNNGSYSGATTATLTLSAAARAMSGDQFQCVISNSVGSVTSSAATLTVSGGVVPRHDVDGDGRSEIAVFRPSNGTWYVRYSSQNYNPATAGTFQWGLPGDLPISGDFDGDGKIELTVFRPANGTWYFRYSSLGYNVAQAVAFQWGLPGDIPIAGDFDGDGKTELTVFRPSNGTWYVRYSSLGYSAISYGIFQWGLPGDVPIAGDFDGDGKTELTVYRPVNGVWYFRYSSLAYDFSQAAAFQWGLPGDIPQVGDFDGDGRAELTVYRPSNGTWYIRYSSLLYSFAGALSFQWGLPGDVPVTADFDGDGKTELAVFRPSNGTWYVRYSSLSYDFSRAAAFQWGLPGDTSVK